MPRRARPGEAEAREPLLGEPRADPPEAQERDSEEGEINIDRNSSNLRHDEGSGQRLTYEEAVEKAGFGLFHALLLVVCGWANASDAVEILCVSFLLPTARCDLQLSTSDMGLLTASIFLGMMVGGYLWGYLADRRGRQRVLVVSLTINGLFGGLASIVPWFWLFLLLRFVSGVGVGGSIPVIFSYFSEFLPRLRRGAMISSLATFWMAGNILAAGLAWLVIPRTQAHFRLGTLDIQSWRIFVVLCSVPSLSSALIFKLLMPESPKFLMESDTSGLRFPLNLYLTVCSLGFHFDGREKEALRVFRLMFELNHWGKNEAFPVFGVLTSTTPTKEWGDGVSRGSPWQRLVSLCRMGLAPIRQLFAAPLRRRSIALLVVFYGISFGYYGLWMWFPELFKRIEEGGSPCTDASRPSPLQNQSCYPVNTAVYLEGFIVAASNLPGNIFTILLMDTIGGKTLLSCSLLVSSVSIFLIYVVRTKAQSLLLSCVFSGVSVISWNALDVVSTELYPTQLRSSALGFFTGVGRVAAIMGNIVFGKLVDTNCSVPILMVSALLLLGGMVACLLPQTRRTELT